MRLLIILLVVANTSYSQKEKLDSMFLYVSSCNDVSLKVNSLGTQIYEIEGVPIDDNFNKIADPEEYSLSIMGDEDFKKFKNAIEKAKDLHLSYSEKAFKNEINDFNIVMKVNLELSAYFTYFGERELSLLPKIFFFFIVKDGIHTTHLLVYKPSDFYNKKRGNSFVIPFCSETDFDRILKITSYENYKLYQSEFEKYNNIFKD